jgi:hypothetical protein
LAELWGAASTSGGTTTITRTTQIQATYTLPVTVTQAADVATYQSVIHAIVDEAHNMTVLWLAKDHAFTNGQLSKPDFIAFERDQEGSYNYREIHSAMQ